MSNGATKPLRALRVGGRAPEALRRFADLPHYLLPIDKLIPPEACGGSKVNRSRARLTVVSAAALGPIAIGLGLVTSAHETHHRFAPILLLSGATVALLPPLLIRALGSLRSAAWCVVLIPLICVSWVCYEDSGLHSLAFPWLLTVPLLAGFVLGPTASIIMGTLVIGVVWWLLVLHSLGHVYPSEMHVETATVWYAVAHAIAIVFTVLLIVLFVQETAKASRTRRRCGEQVRRLASELALAEDRERRRLADEIHIGLCQILASAALKLGNLRENLMHESDLTACDDLNSTVMHAIEAARALMLQVRPPMLLETGFDETARWLAERFEAQHAIPCRFQSDDSAKPLNDDAALALFQMTRECLLNVVKHASAKTVYIRSQVAGGRLIVDVEDDGVGFDPGARAGCLSGNHGFGLFSIRDRLDFLGGALLVRSAPGQGTRIRMSLPLRCSGPAQKYGPAQE